MQETEPSGTQQPNKAGPVRGRERVEFVDILRGFAVFGILVANMASYTGMSRDPHAWSEPIDRAILFLTRFFIEAKFYSLFAFLFGWGMAVQMERAKTRDGSFVSRYLRRLTILLAIGLTHAIFIWTGDILVTYALLGFVLLLFRKRSPAFLLAVSVAALALPIVLSLPGDTMNAFRTWYQNATAFLRTGTLSPSLYASGTYGEITRLRLQETVAGHSWFIYWVGNIFSMFLLGLYVGKRRIFQEADQHITLFRILLGVGLVVGVIFNGIYVLAVARPDLVPPQYTMLATRGARTIGAPALMLFYVSTIILLLRKEEWHRRLVPLASVGRAALSNYISQSILCTLLFYGYGLGLYGEIDPVLALILTIVIFFAQIQISGWWFTRYRFGPLEWLWRTLTYGQAQPLRGGDGSGGWSPTLVHRIRRAAGKVEPRRALVAIWIVLLLWGTGLFFWYRHLEQTELQFAAQIPPIQVRVTATPPAGEAEGQPEDSTASEEAVKPLATPVVQPVTYNPGPAAASDDLWALASAFDVESAMVQIETLTGPPYLGRYTGSPQAWAAGDYIAEQFARYGLQPAGDDSTFFQSFPIDYIALAPGTGLSIEGPDGTVYDQYEAFQDFSPIIRWYSGDATAEGEVVWANDCTPDDLVQVDTVDKILLCRSHGIQEAERDALEHGAAGLLLLTDPEQRPADFGNTYFEPWVPDPLPAMRVYPSTVDELLLGSDRSVEDLSISFSPFPLETRARMEVQSNGPETCPVQGCQGRNVLGVIPGRDPEVANQVIILGAHYDHIGQAPNGIVWPGANDNASGVAVLLEIARAWQEQGYVPRHTVLFAAWDAEEVGLVGAEHYVQNARYPLEDTMAMIQLDMVGSGGDTLWIDGGGELGDHLYSVAGALGWDAQHISQGRSDHIPFMMSGVPANLLIWRFDEGEVEYHRPVDTIESIEPEKLEGAARITGLTILGLSEGNPALNDLLDRRATAITEGDVEIFLATSLAGQKAADRAWFDDLQALLPEGVEMEATDIRILGPEATARVEVSIQLPVDHVGGETETRTSSLQAKFAHDGDGWRWAGPDLDWIEEETGFAVAHPPGQDQGLEGLGEVAAREYARMAAVLGLPGTTDAELLLFPDAQSLRISTSPSLLPGQVSWVEPGTVKLIYSEGISTSQELADAMAQLLLAEAGVTEAAAPWLWQGLPLALRTPADPVDIQTEVLPGLKTAFEQWPAPLTSGTAWSAVEYMRQQIGWQGIGQFVATLGKACRDGLCADSQGLNLALTQALQMNAATFDTAWQGHWRQRLASAQTGLDAVLNERSRAIRAADRAAFVDTVDASVPNLVTEEGYWFDDLVRLSPESVFLTGQPQVLLDGGDILAEVTMEIQFPESSGRSRTGRIPLQVRFNADGEQLRWAGPPFETLTAGSITVLYPEDRQELARAVLEQAQTTQAQLAAELGIEATTNPIIKLYDDNNAFLASIAPVILAGNPALTWSAEGGSVKLRLPDDASTSELQPALTVHLARQLLAGMGVDSEWLLKGAGLYASEPLDGGVAARGAQQYLHKVLQALEKDGLYDLAAMPADHQLEGRDLGLARAQAWDTIRYLVNTYGREALTALLNGQARGLSLDAAMTQATGQTMAEFEAGWAGSFARAHADPEWIEVASRFDQDRASQHIQVLTGPELGGRQAGTAGAEAAASYIAEQFALAGLLPAGDGDQATTYFQTLPITHTTLLSAPRLEIVGGDERTLDALVYRQDFMLAEATGPGGPVTGEMVWIQQSEHEDMDLTGKIMVRKPSNDPALDAAQAVEYGAIGLILAGNETSSKKILAKEPLPLHFPPEYSIPVLELTEEGTTRLLAILGQATASELESAPALPLGIKARLEVPVSTPQVVETANVLGLLPGSDPELSQEVIIIGAHYDHVGDDPPALICLVEGTSASGNAPDTTCEQVEGERYSGANDNASGVGVLLEMARLWNEAGYQPRRTILFAAWGAQEAGQLGSTYYVEHPALPLEQTTSMVQLDSVGGGGGYYLEAQGGREQEGLLLFNLIVAEEWMNGRLAMEVNWAESDQIPFHEAGVPALLIAWRDASEANWPESIADEVQPDRLGSTGRMVSLALMALAR